MAVQTQATPDFEKIVSETDDAHDKDVCVVNITDAASSAPSVQDEDQPYCTRFLSCLTRCLISRPKTRSEQLPIESTKRKSLTMRWLDELEVVPPEQDALPQEVDDVSPEETPVEAALISIQGPSFLPLNEKLIEDSNPRMNVSDLEGDVAAVKYLPEKTEDINKMDALEEPSVQEMPKPEDHHIKTALEEWEEIVQLPTREYFAIEAAVISDRSGAPRSKGLTLHISMDTDKKMYNRPRENVIYENGLIRVQTGGPQTISETQNIKINSLAIVDVDPKLPGNEN